MKAAKRKQLERGGWRVGSAAEFLGLSEAEDRLVEVQLALSAALREGRRNARLTQEELARRLGTSQSRVAKMEGGDPTVTIDLLLRALFVIGASPGDIARAISARVA